MFASFLGLWISKTKYSISRTEKSCEENILEGAVKNFAHCRVVKQERKCFFYYYLKMYGILTRFDLLEYSWFFYSSNACVYRIVYLQMCITWRLEKYGTKKKMHSTLNQLYDMIIYNSML